MTHSEVSEKLLSDFARLSFHDHELAHLIKRQDIVVRLLSIESFARFPLQLRYFRVHSTAFKARK